MRVGFVAGFLLLAGTSQTGAAASAHSATPDRIADARCVVATGIMAKRFGDTRQGDSFRGVGAYFFGRLIGHLETAEVRARIATARTQMPQTQAEATSADCVARMVADMAILD
jgi:hypothetical protein